MYIVQFPLYVQDFSLCLFIRTIRRGPKIEPWVTPDKMSFDDDFMPSVTTHCSR